MDPERSDAMIGDEKGAGHQPVSKGRSPTITKQQSRRSESAGSRRRHPKQRIRGLDEW